MIRNIKLSLNEHAYLLIEVPETLESFKYHDVIISFHERDGKGCVVYDNLLEEGLLVFQTYLKKALNKQLKLDASILPMSKTHDIGYLWDLYNNRIFSEESDSYGDKSTRDIEAFVNNNLPESNRLVFAKDSSGELDWIGMRYYMWSSVAGCPDTWLFNQNDKIYLEITPVYKWHTSDPENDPNFISHEEFVCEYKPIALVEISKSRAQELLTEIQQVLGVIR